MTPEALDGYISGLPCQSANVQIAPKSVSASAVGRRVERTLPASARRAVALEATLRRAIIDQVVSAPLSVTSRCVHGVPEAAARAVRSLTVRRKPRVR